MKNNKTEKIRKCPHCGKTEHQIKAGFNASGTQRYKCKEYGKQYTLEPKKHEYSEETRELALKIYYSGVSARGVARILKMNKSNIANWIKKTKK